MNRQTFDRKTETTKSSYNLAQLQCDQAFLDGYNAGCKEGYDFGCQDGFDKAFKMLHNAFSGNTSPMMQTLKLD